MKMQKLAAALAISTAVAALPAAALAHGEGGSRGMMGQGTMSHGMMGQGSKSHGMMGHKMGRGMMSGGYHGRVTPSRHLTVEDVTHWFGHRIERMGNKRLKLGKVTEKDQDSFVVEIVTKDKGAVVDKFEIDRHSGRMHRVE